jgi:hypothetical protein
MKVHWCLPVDVQAQASRSEMPILYSSSVHVGVRLGVVRRMFYSVCLLIALGLKSSSMSVEANSKMRFPVALMREG